MPGPAPKPADRRQRRNKPTELRAVPPRAIVEVPKAPPGLLKATRDWWSEFWNSDLAAATGAETDLPALRRLASLYDERERAYRAIQRGDRLVTGSKGQEVLNPLYRVIASLDAEIRNLEDRFGLTPLARLRLGITLTDAQKGLEDLNARLAADAAPEDFEDPRGVIDGEVEE